MTPGAAFSRVYDQEILGGATRLGDTRDML